MVNKQHTEKGKNGNAGTWTASGFQPKPAKQTKKTITLLDILLGKK